MLNVNFKQHQIFEYRFRRSPKIWTIDQLHDIWIKAKNRSDNRNRLFWKYLVECYEHLPTTNEQDGKKILYFYKNDKLMRFNIYFRDKSSYSYSTDLVTFNDRDSKLEFWISNDDNIKMGQQLFELEKFNSRKFQYITYQVLFDTVFDKLRTMYKNTTPPGIISVKISDKIYIIGTKGKESYFNSYNSFELIGEYDGNTISL